MDRTPDVRRSLLVGALIGVGQMAALDEIVFHQLLAWHHLYDRAAGDVALLSDGLLHAAELVALVVGFVLLVGLVRRQALAASYTWAGLFLGLGGFQTWDGIVHHKLLELHQVRYGVDPLPYDIAWVGSGLALLLVGWLLLRRARRGGSVPKAPSGAR